MLALKKIFVWVTGQSNSEQKELEKFEFQDKINKESYLNLKNNMKSFSLAAKAIRQEASKSHGQVRHNLREIKKNVGQYARIEHIALSFLRGRLYSECEKNVKNGITSVQLQKHLNVWQLNYKYSISKQYQDDLNRFFGIVDGE